MGWIGKLVNKHSLAATALVTSLIVTGLLPAAPAGATDGQSSPSDEASSSVESAQSGEKTSLDLGVAIDTLNKSVLPAVTAARDTASAEGAGEAGDSTQSWCPSVPWGANPLGFTGQGEYAGNQVEVYVAGDAQFDTDPGDVAVFVKGDLTVGDDETYLDSVDPSDAPYATFDSELGALNAALEALEKQPSGKVSLDGETFTLTGDGQSPVQVFNISAEQAPALADADTVLNLTSIPGEVGDLQSTIILNVEGSGATTVHQNLQLNINGVGVGADEDQDTRTNLTQHLMWRFPQADAVLIGDQTDMDDEADYNFVGTIYAAKEGTDLTVNTPTNGRLLSNGDLGVTASTLEADLATFPLILPDVSACAATTAVSEEAAAPSTDGALVAGDAQAQTAGESANDSEAPESSDKPASQTVETADLPFGEAETAATRQSAWCPPLVWPENPIGPTEAGKYTDNQVNVYAADNAWFYNHEGEGIVFVEGNLHVEVRNTKLCSNPNQSNCPYFLGADYGTGSWPGKDVPVLRVDGTFTANPTSITKNGRVGVIMGGPPYGNPYQESASARPWYAGKTAVNGGNAGDGYTKEEWAHLFPNKRIYTPNVAPFNTFRRDMDKLEDAFSTLQQAPTGTVSVSGNNFTLTGDGQSAVQVFNISSSQASALNNGKTEMRFENIPGKYGDLQATIILNVMGSSVTVHHDIQLYVNGSWVASQEAGGKDWGNLTERMMWRFPEANWVYIGNKNDFTDSNANRQFTGSVFTPNPSVQLEINTPTNGRLISYGKLVINEGYIAASGPWAGPVEYHSFPFVLPGALACEPMGFAAVEKEVDCKDCTSAEKQALEKALADKKFTFTATQDGKDVLTGSNTATVYPGEGMGKGWLVGPFPVGTQVCFNEESYSIPSGWEWESVSYNPSSRCVTVKEGDPNDGWASAVKVLTTNWYKKIPSFGFDVEKRVSQSGGSNSDVNGLVFEFEAVITEPGKSSITERFTLKHGESKSFDGYPRGTMVTVKEVTPNNTPDGYVLTTSGVPHTFTLGDSNGQQNHVTVTAHNDYEKIPEYPFYLKKKIEGIESGDDYLFQGLSFQVDAQVKCGSYSYPTESLTIKSDGSVTQSNNTYPKQKNGSNCKVYLDERTPTNIPDGYTWIGSDVAGGDYIGDNTQSNALVITNTYKPLSKTADIAIKKLTKSADGWQYSAASGWELKAEVITSGVTQSPSKNEYVTSGADGYSRWTVDFNGKTSATVRFSEKQQFGYRLDDIRCTVWRDGSYIDLPNGGQVTPEQYEANGGYGELEFQPGDEVDCWIWNEQYADMDLNKKIANTPGSTDWGFQNPNNTGNAWYLKVEVDSASAGKGGAVQYLKSGDEKQHPASDGFYPAMGSYAWNRWQLDFGDNEEMTLTLTEKAPSNGTNGLEFHSGVCEITHANGNKETFDASTNPWTVTVKRGDQRITCDFNNWTPKDDEGSIKVTKQVCDYNQTSGCPTVDWMVGLEKVSGSLTVTPQKTASNGLWSTAGGGATWKTTGKSTDTAKLKIWEGAGTGNYATASYKSVKCTGQDGTVFLDKSGGTMPNSSSNALTFDRDVKASDNITCTFVNENPEEKTAEITVYKELCEYGASTSNCPKANWTVGLATASGDLKIAASTKPTNGANGATWEVSGPVGAKAKLKLWETNGVANSTFKSLVCENQEGKVLLNKSGGSMPTSESTALTFTEDIYAGDKVTCTFVNEKPVTVIPNDSGSITFQKQTTINGGNPVNAQNWELKLVPVTEGVSITTTTPTSGKTGSDGKLTWGLSFPQGTTKAKFKISEVKQSPYSIASVTCDGVMVSTGAIEGAGAEVELPVKGGSITCTFTNDKTETTTNPGSGDIYLKKYVGDSCSSDTQCAESASKLVNWKVKLESTSDNLTLDSTAQQNTGTGGGAHWNVTFKDKTKSGSVKVTELGPVAADGKTYVVDKFYCRVGSSPTKYTLGQDIPISDGQTLDCYLHNKEQTADKTTVSIKKETYGNTQGTGTMNPGLNWTMKLEATTPGVTVGSETKSTGTTGTATWDDIDFGAWSDMGADFQISEVMTSAQQSQWTLFGGSCSVSGKGSGGSLTNGKISVHLYPGDTVTCTLKNGKTPETSEDPAKLKIYKYLDNSPEIGWEVRALSDDATLSVTSGTKTTNDFVKTTTGGLAAWDIKFDKGKSTAKLSVSERQEEGVKFASGDCTVIRGGSKTETLDLPAGSFVSGTVRDIEFKNPIQPNDTITCNFYNETEKPVQKDDASIRITKMLNGTPAPNWWVSAVSQDSKATLTPGKWGTSQGNGWMTTSANDDGSRGWAEWDVTFNGSNTQSVIQVTEKQQPGYEFSGGTCEVWDDNQQPEVLVNTIKIKATDFQPNVDGTVLFTLETPIKKGYSIACDFDNSTIVGPPPATVTVEKRLYENETGEGTGTLGSGWKLKLHSNTTGVTVNPEEKTTTSTGQVSWSVDFNGKDSAQFEISEVMTTAQQNDGWKLVGGTCSVTGQGSGGTVSGGKINVTLYPGDSVSCTLKNGRPGIEPAQVLLQKTIEGTLQKDWCLELSKGNSDATVTGTGTTAGCVTGFRKSESVTWNGGTEIGTKWTVEFPRDNQEAKLKVSEVQQAGFKYDGGSCVISGPTGDRFATLSGSPEYTSKAELSEPIKPGDKVVCELKNKLKPEDLDEGKIKFRKLTKQELNIGGYPTTIWGGAQDWELRLQSETPGVTVAPPGGQPGDWVTTDANGYTTWDLTYPKGTTSFQVNLAEKKQSGWSLTSGDCKVTGGTSVNIATADLSAAQTDKGATISMKPGSELECTFKNEEVSETPGEVKIVKQVCDSVTSNNCSPADWTVGLAWESGKLLLEDDAEPKKTGTTGAVWKTTGATGAKAKLKIWEVNPPESNTELRSVTCKVGNDVVATWDGSTAPTSKETALVFSKEITAGDEVNCEFVNHKLVEQTPAKLWVKKTLCDEDGKNCQTAVKEWKFGVEVPESQPQGQQGVTITKGDNPQLTGVNGAVWELTGTKDKPFDLVLWEEANGNDFQKMECRTRKYGQTPEASWGNWQSIADTTTVTGSDGKQHPGAVLTFNSGDELDCVMTNNKPVVKAEGKIELFKATFDMNANGDLTNAQWGSGWELKLTSATNGVTVNPGDGFQKTGSDGKTSWTVTFPEKLETADFYLREVNQPGYNLHNLTCKSSTGGDIDVSAAVKDPGAKVTLKLDDLKKGTAISCQFDNVVPPVVAEDSAQVFLSKVNDETGARLPDWCVRLAGSNGVLVGAAEGSQLCEGGNNFQKTKAGTSYPGPDAGVKDRTGTLWEIGFPKGVTSTTLKLSENPSQAQKDAGWEFVSGSCQIKRANTPPFEAKLTGKSAVWTDEMTLDTEIKAGDIVDCELRNSLGTPMSDATITVQKQVCDSSSCAAADWSVGLKQSSGFANGSVEGKSPQTATKTKAAEWTIKNSNGLGVGVKLWEATSDKHTFANLKCTKNGSLVPFYTHQGGMPTEDDPSDVLNVLPGDKVDCTFTNNVDVPQTSKITITKEYWTGVSGNGGTVSYPEWQIGVSKGDDQNWTISPDGAQTANAGNKKGVVEWDLSVPKGQKVTVNLWEEQSKSKPSDFRKLTCKIGNGSSEDIQIGGKMPTKDEPASVEITAGQNLTCWFHNAEEETAEVFVHKTVTGDDGGTQQPDWCILLSGGDASKSGATVKPKGGTGSKDCLVDGEDLGFQSTAKAKNEYSGKEEVGTAWTVVFNEGKKEAVLDLSELQKTGYAYTKANLQCKVRHADNTTGSWWIEWADGNAEYPGSIQVPGTSAAPEHAKIRPGDEISCELKNEPAKTAQIKLQKVLYADPTPGGANNAFKNNWWVRVKETENSGVKVVPSANVKEENLDADGFQKTADYSAYWDVTFGKDKNGKEVTSAKVNLSEKIDREINNGEFENVQYSQMRCTGIDGTPIDLNGAEWPNQVLIDIKPGQEVLCKFDNVRTAEPAEIEIKKFTYSDPDGTENEAPGEGYQFQLAVPSGQPATVSPTGINKTDKDGIAKWKVDFKGNESAQLNLSEILTGDQQQKVTLLGGACTITHTDGTNESVTIGKDALSPGSAKIAFRPGDSVRCYVKNAPKKLVETDISIEKVLYNGPNGTGGTQTANWYTKAEPNQASAAAGVTVSNTTSGSSKPGMEGGWIATNNQNQTTWKVNFGGNDKATIIVSEKAQDGYELTGWSCSVIHDGTVTNNQGKLTEGKDQIDIELEVNAGIVDKANRINCTFENSPRQPLTLQKQTTSIPGGSENADDWKLEQTWMVGAEIRDEQAKKNGASVEFTKKCDNGTYTGAPLDGFYPTLGDKNPCARWWVEFGQNTELTLWVSEQGKDPYVFYGASCTIVGQDGKSRTEIAERTPGEAELDKAFPITVYPGDRSISCTFQNAQPGGGVEWEKVSATETNPDGDLLGLTGSKWQIWSLDANGERDKLVADQIEGLQSCNEQGEDCVITNRFMVGNLTPGKYHLIEVVAPEGHSLLVTPIEFEVASGQISQLDLGAIENSKASIGPNLPMAGGLGTLIFIVVAGGSSAVAITLGVFARKRRGRHSL